MFVSISGSAVKVSGKKKLQSNVDHYLIYITADDIQQKEFRYHLKFNSSFNRWCQLSEYCLFINIIIM